MLRTLASKSDLTKLENSLWQKIRTEKSIELLQNYKKFAFGRPDSDINSKDIKGA